MPKHLTDAQVDHYRDRGSIAPLDLLTASEAAEARAKLEAYEARSGGPLGGAQRAGGHLLWPWIDELMRHETLLDAVEDLIGPNILCWNSIFWIKEASSINHKRAKRQQGGNENPTSFFQIPAGRVFCVEQYAAKPEKQEAVNQTDNSHRQWLSPHIFQRHGNAEENEKRNTFCNADQA